MGKSQFQFLMMGHFKRGSPISMVRCLTEQHKINYIEDYEQESFHLAYSASQFNLVNI